MKNLWLALRRFLARHLLRGRLLSLWLRHRTQRLAAAYSQLLVHTLARAPVKPPPSRTGAHTPLRRLLFVCDNMWEERELLPELQRICEVTFINVAPWKLPAQRVAEERLDAPAIDHHLRSLGDQAFDAIVVYLHGGLLSEELISLLRQQWPCPLLGMNLDDKTTFANYPVFRGCALNYRRWAGAFDCNLSNSRSMVDVYHAEGFPCLYLPTGFHYDPAIHTPELPEHYEHTLSFVGSYKPERGQLIAQLAGRGIDVALFGSGWPDGKFTSEGWRIFRRSQMNLGIGYNVQGDQVTNLKNRDFECPGSGGCYLTTYDWELAELFEVGREILCYRNVDELVELYCHYRRRPERCREIARAGFQRAIRDHTWEQRFRQVFAALGFTLREPILPKSRS